MSTASPTTTSTFAKPTAGTIHLWSGTLIPTTRDAPTDAESPSHILLSRAGYIRKLGAGIYDYLPLAWRVLRKVSQIVREEMDAAGASELLLPALLPIELYDGTKRHLDYGDLLFKVTDRKGGLYALGPTHEEPITELVKGSVTSYKQLPLNLYQIQTKYRDEARPRSGLLRCREFIMKDAYSFHTHVEGPGGLNETYDKMFTAYSNVFKRCGLDFTPVEAEAGPIGGSASHEFMVNAESGEDTILKCTATGYAANVEKCEIGERPRGTFTEPATGELTEVHTPNLPGIDEVGKFMKVKPQNMLKTIVFIAAKNVEDYIGYERQLEALHDAILNAGQDPVGVALMTSDELREMFRPLGPDEAEKMLRHHRTLRKDFSDHTFVAVVVRGDHEVNEGKVKALVSRLAGFPVQIVLPSAKILAVMGIPVGFVSPSIVNNRRFSPLLLVDPDASVGGFWASGGDKRDYHVKHFNWRREVGAKLDDSEQVVVADVRNAIVGDPSPRKAGEKLVAGRGIEVGHIFKLGTKYSDAMGFKILNAQQQSQSVIMGCYGIGVSRAMASSVEQNHDADGIIWPVGIAPYHVIIQTLKPEHITVAKQIASDLSRAGVDVLIDDRDERPGVKFKDADLIGIPVRLVLGDKALAENAVEFKPRKSKDKPVNVPMGEVVAKVIAALS